MSWRRVLLGFVAGSIATLVFHQGGLALLHAANLTERAAYVMRPTGPFGVPQVLSLAFWGGVWGIVLAAFLAKTGASRTYLLRALAFGAIAPTLVAFFLVAPLKDLPMAGGGDPKIIAGALILNGLWGLGTGLILGLFRA
jgi:uncharacterized membrane protein